GVTEHSPPEATKSKWHILECYISLGRYAEACDLAQQIVASNRQFDDAFELGRTLVQLAVTEAELANFGPARAALDEAETIFGKLGASSWTSTVWLRRGRLDLLQGDPATAATEAARAAVAFDAAGQQGHSA